MEKLNEITKDRGRDSRRRNEKLGSDPRRKIIYAVCWLEIEYKSI